MYRFFFVCTVFQQHSRTTIDIAVMLYQVLVTYRCFKIHRGLQRLYANTMPIYLRDLITVGSEYSPHTRHDSAPSLFCCLLATRVHLN